MKITINTPSNKIRNNIEKAINRLKERICSACHNPKFATFCRTEIHLQKKSPFLF
jgi:hypothetical protein